MSVKTPTKSAKAAAAPTNPSREAKVLAVLEAKVAALEAKLEEQAKLLAGLKSQPAPVTSSGRDEALVAELRRYFSTASSGKLVTYWPKL